MAASWFSHCYFEVCQLNAFCRAVTEVEKGYVRVYFSLCQGRQQMIDISGCKYYDLMSVMKFNTDIQYVGVILQ